MTLAFSLFAVMGCILLFVRMWPRKDTVSRISGPWPKVSVIVPARNEEHVLGKLLQSLKQLNYPNFEVIVVDDCSSDKTAAIAQSFGYLVLRGAPKPQDWNGKQWACYQGAKIASGEYLLFTDADTWHHPQGLSTMMAAMVDKQWDVASTLPFHEGHTWWEKCMGPFHVLLLAATRPYQFPRQRHLFAIGQYLLFKKSFYRHIDGHQSVKQAIVEDIPIVNASLAAGGRYAVIRARDIFKVRMYSTLREFIQGWRRNFRAGMRYSTPITFLEITAFISALVGAGHLSTMFMTIAGSFVVLVVAQKRLGNFSVLGACLFPFSLAMLCWITLLSLCDEIKGHPITWKQRGIEPF